MSVTRTTVYLDESTALEVRRLADAEQRPQAEIIREALHSFLKQKSSRGSRKLPPGVGHFHSGRSDISERAEDLLRAAARKRR